jgi:flagellar assembly protein FliH
MSTDARRLSGAVSTNRFSWQGGAPPSAPFVMPMLRRATATAAVPLVPTPAAESIDSPADRLAAAERDAFASGFAQGERDGEAAAARQADALLSRLAATIDEIAALRGGIMRRAEHDMVRLAVAMAERVLRRAVDVDRELLLVMARSAVDRLGDHTVATIHLNPIDLDVLTAGGPPLFRKSVDLVPDAHVARGGCLVRSDFGTVDVGIEAQIRELTYSLLGEHRNEPEEQPDVDPARP